jgi:hypothetical protein
MPPEVEFDNLDVGEIEGVIPRAWWGLVDLWTLEEGRSAKKVRFSAVLGREPDVEVGLVQRMRACVRLAGLRSRGISLCRG